MDPRHLNDVGVDDLPIGGQAVASHGYVGPKTDTDIWTALDRTNAGQAVAAIRSLFGSEMTGLTPEWFLEPESVSRFGVRTFLIEILTRKDGGDFKAAYARRIQPEVDGARTNMIPLKELKTNERASGRHKDLADLENLP